MEDIQKLKDLINGSDNILITSHVSPDPDSICSILLLGLTLKTNYPDKKISMVSEEPANSLKFLPGYNKIKIQHLADAIEGQDLIIVVDAMNFRRCTRGNHQAISQKIKDNNIKLAIIDHHEPVDVEDNAVYINEVYPAAVEQVYNTLLGKLNLKKPVGFAEVTLTGLYSDTGGFTYLNGHYKETLALIGELMDEGIKIEDLKSRLYQYSEPQMEVLSEMLKNISHQDDYTYTYITDAFIDSWSNSGKPLEELHTATKIFTDNFIRNIEGRLWGFIVYQDSRLGENIYSISLRSVGGKPNVADIAVKLNGGGHKAAAGARVQAKSVEEAVQKIQNVISEGS
jgi:phosphoesterase RecJ-like protein